MLQEAGSSTARQRVRLTKDGAAYLTNYARTVNSYPTKTEKETILAGLRAIPGNESWTLPKLSSWFARHRNPSGLSQTNVYPNSAYFPAFAGDPHTLVLLDEETILFPKLTPHHLQQLRALYKKRPEPSEGIITFWAERIKAERVEVVAWIQYQQEKAKENARTTPVSPEIPLQHLLGDISDGASISPTVPEFPRPHLPTPAKSPSVSPHTRMPSLPPIAVKVEELRQCLSPVSLLDTPSTLLNPRPASCMQPSESPFVLEGLPPLSRLHLKTAKSSPISPFIPNTPWHGKELHRRDSYGMLTASIRESLRIDATSSETLPRTAGEFAEKFEKVENMIEVFMEKYDSGQLAPLGWDLRSLGKATS